MSATNHSPSPLQRFFDQALNRGNLDIVDELFSVNNVSHIDRWGLPSDRTGLKVFIATLRSGFPDLHCTIEHEMRTGEWSAARWMMRGTHRGLFLGNPPTGRLVEIPGMIFARLKNDRIAEDWTLIDRMSILQQLGVIPPVTRKEQ